ncbi:receptor-type tyrosine-protein phosphatase eta [Carlito syrichta]|uniref:Receptor-type tyrosine-protein phosphatase eta n=1 Tax=Carlito syrichta TaxID=1868482 RepID=A0A1U7SN38_CARSF|nr:receptor-type tyrosine-protein phosphatase eta [Carlito syrichta]
MDSWVMPTLLPSSLMTTVSATDCFSNGSFSFTSTTTEIHLTEMPGNFSVTNVTGLSDQFHWNSQSDGDWKNPLGGLAPGTNYSFCFSDGATACCQEVSTRPSHVVDIKAVFKSPTSVTLTWNNSDATASKYKYRIKYQVESEQTITVDGQTTYNITGLSPATPYTVSITPGIGSGSWGDPVAINVTTEPRPVSGLHVSFVSVREAALSWSGDNGTASCRMLLESIGSHEESTRDLVANIPGLKPGIQHINPYLPEFDGTQRHPLMTESGLDANNTERSWTESWARPGSSPTAPVHDGNLRGHTDPSSDKRSQDTEVWLVRLAPGTQFKATVYSQAADGTEGQPQAVDFKTNCSQVFDITVVNISATSVTLTWKISDNESSSVYTYKIHVSGETEAFNLTVSETHAVIPGLHSSTFYSITVHPFLAGAECMPGFLQVYTPPGPVSDFRVTMVSTREIGLAWRSNDSESFNMHITQHREKSWVVTTTNQSIVVGDLDPGTNYSFEIFPQGPNGTEGPSRIVYSRTAPSAVYDIQVVNVTTTEMQLEWRSIDNASEYTYHLVVQSVHGSNHTSTPHKELTLWGLVPGTLYNITVSPEVDHVRGDANSIAQFTRPSRVSITGVRTNTTVAELSWQNFDEASPTYFYLLLIEKVGDVSNATQVVTGVGVTCTAVTELTPGSAYNVEIFAQVGNATESLEPGQKSFCTDPAPVASFHCDMVPKEPSLVLRWACPPGANTGFELGVSSGAWDNRTRLENCSSENSTEYRTEVTYLNFSTSYNISVTTVSCGKMAPPTQNTCVTGITDPPPPDGSPNVTSVSHNSVKVKFSGFEASHGPIKAYAVILTTGEAGHTSADVLKYTYDDFKKGTSDTYVTYLVRTEEEGRSQGLSELLKYEINVGNESTTLGYYNGKLEPLGSYRACVAGFTNITFHPHNLGLIDGAESYVSFSPYSDAVFLPQDPGVICGAVFGCIFGALVIVAVGGFIFWRKKRKDAKNNEVSFSQIKPKKSKLIRVENFEAYFKKQQADSNCGFAEEYEDLKLVGISQPKYAAELAENRGKNRYNNVLPYDISRVKLSVQTHSTDDYINANYMPGYHSKKDFIATQGPLPNTLKDFWRMVWEKNVYAVIMLTKCVEQGRTKCEEYWPTKQSQDYGDITVAMTSEIVLPEWTIRDFTVKNILTSESHPLRQFHFTSWPDHGVPDTTDLLLNFRYLVRDYMKQSPPESPILVHCSAGVGRTGTFIAIDRLIYQIENESTVDVYGIVYDLRMHRPLMVQTEDQYVFLNQCVLDIVRSQKDSKVDLIYQNTTAMTIYENLAPVTTSGKTNGYIA